MAASPRWKVYSEAKKYMGACVEVEGAAALAGLYGEGATIRDGHRTVVWTEGVDVGDVAETVWQRVNEAAEQRKAKQAAALAKWEQRKVYP